MAYGYFRYMKNRYNVHAEVVKLILKHKKNLHGLKIKDFLTHSDEVVELHEEICDYYNVGPVPRSSFLFES
jgi:hypothetical protein